MLSTDNQSLQLSLSLKIVKSKVLNQYSLKAIRNLVSMSWVLSSRK